MKNEPYSHRQLCAIAVRWLKRPIGAGGPGCQVAVSEVQSSCGTEVVDAIGVRAVLWETQTVLIEVKTSRADFLADAKKPHRRQPENGVGQFRYFLAPEGLLRAEELPTGWGLLQVNSRGRCQVVVGHVLATRYPQDARIQAQSHWLHAHDPIKEVGLLAKLFARIGDEQALQESLKKSRSYQARLERLLEEKSESAVRAWSQVGALCEQLESLGVEPQREATASQRHVTPVRAIPRKPRLREDMRDEAGCQ